MNDRIQELAQQHGFIHEFMTTGERNDALQKYKKFAELIIEECIAQCWSVSELEHNGYVVSECSKRVRKHFGVEV